MDYLHPVNLRNRSYQLELLDQPGIPFDDIRRNMMELDFINTWLGGHAITIRGFNECIAGKQQQAISAFEIGSGGGDNLRTVLHYCKGRKIKVELRGIDINKECVEFARLQNKHECIHFIHADYRDYKFQEKPDIIFSSLFCHHFNDEELVKQLRWMRDHSRLGFFINDLHRHPIAYFFIKWATRLFSKSYLVKNDAPLSVRRGFTRRDWNQLLAQAGIQQYRLKWQWAFRWLVIVT